MKTIIATLSLLALISAQAASISPRTVSVIESRIENQKVALDKKVSSANTDDMVQGKVVAVMSYDVEVLLENAEKMLESVNADKNSSDKAIAKKVSEIKAVLDASDLLINQI